MCAFSLCICLKFHVSYNVGTDESKLLSIVIILRSSSDTQMLSSSRTDFFSRFVHWPATMFKEGDQGLHNNSGSLTCPD